MAARENDRRAPVRTCVQCGAREAKGALLRIAGGPGGHWETDPRGRKPGRGFYLCRTEACIGGFVRRIGAPKGRARWRMGPEAGAALAAQLATFRKDEATQ